MTFPLGSATPTHAASQLERWLLTGVLFLIVITYAGLGRDVFFNKLEGASGDIISATLPYQRVAACGFALLIVAAIGERHAVSRAIPVVFLPYVMWAAASAMWSTDTMTTIRNAGGLVAMAVALPVLLNRIGIEQATRVVVSVTAFVLVASFALAVFVPEIGRHSGLEMVQSSHVGRWRGIFSHKNGLGAWAAIGSVILFTHGRYGFRSPVMRGLAWMSALACLVMSQSVTALGTAGFMGASWVTLGVMRRTSPAAGFVFAVLIGLGCTAAILTVGDQLFELVGRDSTFTGRSLIWAVAFHFIDKQPLLGFGFTTFGGPEFLALLADTFGQALPGPESAYLLILLETGIIGLALFMIPFLVAARSGFVRLGQASQDERPCIELMLMILLGTLVPAVAEAGTFVLFGPAAIVNYIALFSLLQPFRARSRVREPLAFFRPVPRPALDPAHLAPATSAGTTVERPA